MNLIQIIRHQKKQSLNQKFSLNQMSLKKKHQLRLSQSLNLLKQN